MSKKTFSKWLLVFVALVGFGLFAHPPQAAAKDLFTSGTSGIDCSGEAKDSAVCAEHGTTDNPFADKVGKITDIVAFISGAVAVIMIIIGGLRYITAVGDTSKITTGKDMITHALVGLIVIALARTIIAFVVNRL